MPLRPLIARLPRYSAPCLIRSPSTSSRMAAATASLEPSGTCRSPSAVTMVTSLSARRSRSPGARCRSPRPRRGACARASPRPRSTAPAPCSAAKPTSVWPGRARAAPAPRARLGGLQLERQPVAARSWRSCPSTASAGRKSATAAAISSTSAPANSSRAAASSSAAVSTSTQPHAGRRSAAPRSRATSVTSAPRRAASAASASPMRPGRAVAHVADRVDRLARAAGGHEHAQPVHRRRRRLPSRPSTRLEDARRLGQPPHTPLPARGERARCSGSHDRRAARAQELQVRLRRRVLVHVVVHRRARPRAARVEASAALVSRLSASPCGELGERVGRRGRDAEHVGAPDQLQVRDRVVRRAPARPG